MYKRILKALNPIYNVLSFIIEYIQLFLNIKRKFVSFIIP